uniref:Uncharacterized protein n=1 Tax=Pristionchus pacificus TaxID=54126 RepID=A0A2A6BX09_PRIPA|eukprot:PDM70429.1 hypothetical protein PRIPAC_46675 [Pristionchus pacificus]
MIDVAHCQSCILNSKDEGRKEVALNNFHMSQASTMKYPPKYQSRIESRKGTTKAEDEASEEGISRNADSGPF